MLRPAKKDRNENTTKNTNRNKPFSTTMKVNQEHQ